MVDARPKARFGATRPRSIENEVASTYWRSSRLAARYTKKSFCRRAPTDRATRYRASRFATCRRPRGHSEGFVEELRCEARVLDECAPTFWYRQESPEHVGELVRQGLVSGEEESRYE